MLRWECRGGFEVDEYVKLRLLGRFILAGRLNARFSECGWVFGIRVGFA